MIDTTTTQPVPPDLSDPHQILTIDQVCAWLRIKPTTAYKWACKGKIPSVRIGGSRRFRVRDIQRWLDARTEGR